MIKQTTLRIPPEKMADLEFIKNAAARALAMDFQAIDAVQICRRSVDGRSRMPVFQVQVAVYAGEPLQELCRPVLYCPVSNHSANPGKKVVVVGGGTCRAFCCTPAY